MHSVSTSRLSALHDSRWDSPRALHGWARATGIEPDLADPAMLALAGFDDERVAAELRGSFTTVEELAAPAPELLASLRSSLGARPLERAQDAARSYLDEKAFARLGHGRTAQACEARWAEAPDDPILGPVVQRLRKVRFDRSLRGGPTPKAPARWTFHEEPSRMDVLVDVPGPTPWSPGARHSVVVKLGGPPEPWCSCRAFGCGHVVPALDAILEGLLDPSCSLAADLHARLSAPEWERTLGRIDAALARLGSTAQEDEDPPARIAWKLTPSPSGGAPEITALLQKRQRSGRYSAGVQVRHHDQAVVDAGHPRDAARLRLLQSQASWLPEHQREALLRQVLLELCGHPHVFLAGPPLRPVEVRAAPLQVALEEAGDGSLSFMAKLDGMHVPLDLLLPQLRSRSFDGTAVLLDEASARCIVAQVAPKVRELFLALGGSAHTFPAEAAPALLERASRIATVVPMAIPENLLGDEVPARNEVVVRVERTGPVSLRLQILVVSAPGGGALVPGQGIETAPGTDDGRRVWVRRSPRAETAAAFEVQEALRLPDAEGFAWSVAGDDALDLLAPLGELAVRVEWSSERWRVTQAARTDAVSLHLVPKRDWLGLDGTIEVDGERLQLAEALDAARRGARYVQASADTWIALSDELRRKLALVADQTYGGRGGLEASFATLPALEALVDGGGTFDAGHELLGMLDRMRKAADLEPKVPDAIRAELRPYQVEGFRWLARLAAWGGGGCLADDMGLGKTLQALALLVHRAKDGPALVVAPTSVCGNWVREAERFAPDLRPVVFGALPDTERERTVEGLGPDDVLIVSYTYLTRERELLAGKRFATLVLDEAQAIKNAQTERARVSRSLDADVRIALSGTPLENHVGELWSLFQVAVPGLLGSWEQFRHRFGLPIERDGDASRKVALSRVLRPFLLRRTKQEVASELPPRTEIDEFVELSKDERGLYEQARLAAVARVKGVAGTMPPEKARFEVLAAITRLRLASCHPALYDPESKVESSKLERIVELLVQLRDEGHRALVFSQFTKHLALVREAVEKAGLTALYLDGQTPGAARQELVDAFQCGEADHFLISLKAGGSGLNLTAADFVLHLDPWWNPAVEDQASDRAHRIGQTRPVTVIRLIARKTIEEQILSLHAQKRDLVSSILDGSDRAGAIGTEDLIRLIEGSLDE